MEEQVSHQDKVIGSNPIIGTNKVIILKSINIL